jgi:putative ATP-dependent endonuclease of OLD family
MQVALLEIQNFRGIRTGKLQFRDHTVLIGTNNSSKTTIVEALALVFGRDRLVRNLTEHDFFGSNPQPAD